MDPAESEAEAEAEADSERPIVERHLTSLWVSVRDAANVVHGRGLAQSAIGRALAVEARRLAETLDAAAAGQPPPARLVRDAGARMKLLLVDDDACSLLPLQKLLAAEFEIFTTTDATQVVRLIEEHRPDAVVTDLYMPELDGLALVDLIRRLPGGPPVLVVTAAVDAARQLEALEMGAFDFITKPIDVPDLRARIHRAVRHARELDRLRTLEQTDALTGLLNRRAFNEVVAAALADRRTEGTVALVLIDEDGLKRINDAFGHAAGDRAIETIARTVDWARRRSDFAARIGGDEFALVMPGADRVAADRVMGRIDEALAAAPMTLADGRQVPLAISWGVATDDGTPRTAAGLFDRADAALYAMKRARRKT